MSNAVTDWIIKRVSQWLLKEDPPQRAYLCDFNFICSDIRPGDVLLIEGRSRASRIIKYISQSAWSHAALYIGQLDDILDPKIREIAKQHCECSSSRQLLIESEIGLGTIISSITRYQNDHVRILRPRRLTKEDEQQIINFAISRLGKRYSARHLLDLARFLFPWGLWPRKWRSSLFQHNALQPTEDICSSMIADAFQSIRYPILPLVRKNPQDELELVLRNSRLFTPSDFDYSPYFDVIKYPIFPLENEGEYKSLPWREDLISDDKGSIFTIKLDEKMMDTAASRIKTFFTSEAFAVVGASPSRAKFGNKVLRCYLQHNKKVYPINPNEKKIEELSCISHLNDLPDEVKSISIVTPPNVTEQIVDEAISKGIKNIWMQPGAESPLAIENCYKHHINVIAGGACILMELGFQE